MHEHNFSNWCDCSKRVKRTIHWCSCPSSGFEIKRSKCIAKGCRLILPRFSTYAFNVLLNIPISVGVFFHANTFFKSKMFLGHFGFRLGNHLFCKYFWRLEKIKHKITIPFFGTDFNFCAFIFNHHNSVSIHFI